MKKTELNPSNKGSAKLFHQPHDSFNQESLRMRM